MPILGAREIERDLRNRKAGPPSKGGQQHPLPATDSRAFQGGQRGRRHPQHRQQDDSRPQQHRNQYQPQQTGGRYQRNRSASRDSRISQGHNNDLSNGGGGGGRRSRNRRQRSSSVASTASRGSVLSRGTSVGGRSDGAPNPRKHLKKVRLQLRKKYNDKAMDLVKKYIDDSLLSAELVNNFNYLRRCLELGVISSEYWMSNPHVRNTREVLNNLDRCSYQLMCLDQDYQHVRRGQVSRQLAKTEERLQKILSPTDLHKFLSAVKLHRGEVFDRIREGQRAAIEELRLETREYQEYLREKRRPRNQKDEDKKGAEGPQGGRGAKGRFAGRRFNSRHPNNRRDVDRTASKKKDDGEESDLTVEGGDGKTASEVTKHGAHHGAHHGKGSRHVVHRRTADSLSSEGDSHESDVDEEVSARPITA